MKYLLVFHYLLLQVLLQLLFYGDIKRVHSSPYVFDKIYPNRTIMDEKCASDGVYIGRYVLIEYNCCYENENSDELVYFDRINADSENSSIDDRYQANIDADTTKYKDTNGTLIIFVKTSKEFKIYNYGNNNKLVSADNLNKIYEQIKEYTESNKILIATTIVFKQINLLLNGKELQEAIKEEYSYNDNKIIIEDDASLLSSDEIKQLKDDMLPLTEYGNVAFKTININETYTSNYAATYYYEQFGQKSGTLFLIDMDKREIYIYSDGSNKNIITSRKATIITDNIYRYASRGEYYKCAKEAFNEINTLLAGGKIMEPMRHISNIFIAIIFGFLLNFLILVKHTKMRKAKAKEILNKCDINTSISNIKANKIGVEKVYSPIANDSDGFSSGGSSSSGGHSSGGGGGGHSGSGGGHRF